MHMFMLHNLISDYFKFQRKFAVKFYFGLTGCFRLIALGKRISRVKLLTNVSSIAILDPLECYAFLALYRLCVSQDLDCYSTIMPLTSLFRVNSISYSVKLVNRTA